MPRISDPIDSGSVAASSRSPPFRRLPFLTVADTPLGRVPVSAVDARLSNQTRGGVNGDGCRSTRSSAWRGTCRRGLAGLSAMGPAKSSLRSVLQRDRKSAECDLKSQCLQFTNVLREVYIKAHAVQAEYAVARTALPQKMRCAFVACWCRPVGVTARAFRQSGNFELDAVKTPPLGGLDREQRDASARTWAVGAALDVVAYCARGQIPMSTLPRASAPRTRATLPATIIIPRHLRKTMKLL